MDIYVKSRGVSIDVYWQKIEESSAVKQEPTVLEKVLALIDSDYPSLALFRQNSKLLLLVTALDTKKRTDNRMRKIRNSIVWIGDDNRETEKVLRSLVIQYCNDVNSLALPMDEAVSNTKDGFSVDYSNLPSLEIHKKLGNESPDLTLKIGNLENLRQELAEELQKFKIPTEKEGFLIVLSEVNSKKSFQSAQVWRGLSKQIQSDEWEVIKEDNNFFRKPSKSNQGNNSRSMATTVMEEKKFSLNILTMLLSLCLIISIIGNIWQWNQLKDIKNLDEIKQKIKDETRKLQGLQSDVKFYQQQKENLESYFKDFHGDFQNFQHNVGQVFEAVDARKASESKSHS